MTPLVVPVWTWRDAIRKANVPPLTKLVCLCIANYVSDVGQGCFPSVKTLMADSGMSNRSVATHIQLAVEAGLLEIEREAGKDGRFGRSTYYPRFPDNAVLKRRAERCAEPVDDDEDENAQVKDAHAVYPGEGASRGQSVQVKELHVVRPGEAASPGPREPGALHHVKELHAELSSRELSKDSPSPPPGGEAVGGRGKTNRLRVEWIEELRAEGHPHHVLDELLGRLVAGGLLPPKDIPDVTGWGRQVCLDLRRENAATIDALRERVLTKHRYRMPSVSDFRVLAGELREEGQRLDAELRRNAKLREVPVDTAASANFRAALVDIASPDHVRAWFEPGGVVGVSTLQGVPRVQVVTPHSPRIVAAQAASLFTAAARVVWGRTAEVDFIEGRAA